MSEAVATQAFDAHATALEDFDVSSAKLMQSDQHWDYFARLRDEAPVHYCKDSMFGPYWSITRFADIMEIEKNWQDFSSDLGITLGDRPEDFSTPNFIGMDPPKHDQQRQTVQGVVAPMNLKQMESLIRQRAVNILQSLPVGETFNWVDLVSVELTTQMLATIFDFPFEDRYKLTYWSDMATSGELGGGPTPEAERRAALLECLEYFTKLREKRGNEPPKIDLLSMLAHGKDTQNMPPMEFLGNLVLLIVGGNDTTRNSMTGGVVFFNENPREFEKLRNETSLIPSMVSEVIRFQTPLPHMRRTLTRDFEFKGHRMKEGDKVVLWYCSANRDEAVIKNPDSFVIDRESPRNHASFGFGIHRCMGNRLAEMQLRVLWEECLDLFESIEVQAEPKRLSNNFVRGYSELEVVVKRH